MNDAIGMMLPDAQAHRELARALKLRVRADLAEDRFDAAIHGIRIGFQLGQRVGEGPSMIHMLVGLAITGVFTGEIDEFIRRPGAPNLYWALTTLPDPFIDPRAGLEGEARFFESILPHADELDAGPVSAARANQILEEMFATFRRGGPTDDGGVGGLLGKFGLTTYVALHYPEAKVQLIALGRPAAVVEKMPAAQVVALRSVTVIRALYDDYVKCFHLPYPRAVAEFARLRKQADEWKKQNEGDALLSVFLLTLPAIEKVHNAHARVGRRIAGVRAVEAVRLHAALNDGRVPGKLADITAVPVPTDPWTGKPFAYTADGTTFALFAPPPAGEQPHTGNSFRYEVTVRGK